ncbi:MAG: AmmeMemoRadiSam system protein B [Candidatus Omnitrophota bacterium]
MRIIKRKTCSLLLLPNVFILAIFSLSLAEEVKRPSVAGSFYPDDPQELSILLDSYLDHAGTFAQDAAIFAILSPHAGYEFSGSIAAQGYKLIKNKGFKTVVLIGSSHYYGFQGVSLYPQGAFETPLGKLYIDNDFRENLIKKTPDLRFDPRAYEKEHTIEVQLPFLQKVLTDFKIVPIMMGQGGLDTCKMLAEALIYAINGRDDVLIVASTDMYHGYDYREARVIDEHTLSYISAMDTDGLFAGITKGSAQLCGGLPVITTLLTAKALGFDKVSVLKYTNSSEVTGKKIPGIWTVGYSSCVIAGAYPRGTKKAGLNASKAENGGNTMLNKEQRARSLKIARDSISSFLKDGTIEPINETDKAFHEQCGAFVTLHKNGQLRGCIGSIIGTQALYLTIRDMAREAATGDPRFPSVTSSELKDIEIEISVLSPLIRVRSVDEIKIPGHGVLVKRGSQSGVFLPQVADETHWSKEEFLSYLCAHKAGLPSGAWKEKSTELYVFTAEVFSEKSIR